MKLKELLYLAAGILLTATLIPTFMSATELDISAQISVQPTPTHTSTPIPPTPTFTPIPPTPTFTPIPPTPTFTPIPPTPTFTPIPPTPTFTPVPPTPTPTPRLPQLGLITVVPSDGVAAVGEVLGFTAVFTDPPDPPDFATWFWGDGGTTPCSPGSADCTVNPGSGTQGTLVASHAYSEAGIYTVQVEMRDSHNQGDTSTYEFVVVYDLSAGSVTGGGWIDSPRGAYAPDPSLTGQATFGFVSRYKRGSTRPTGNTLFQFKVADLRFISDTFNWLVVNQNGTNAQFKGTGTVNGASAPTGEDYRFMIWATDGSSSDTTDTFHIKIWYEDGDLEFVIYDNGVAQAIGGGNITVRRASKK